MHKRALIAADEWAEYSIMRWPCVQHQTSSAPARLPQKRQQAVSGRERATLSVTESMPRWVVMETIVALLILDHQPLFGRPSNFVTAGYVHHDRITPTRAFASHRGIDRRQISVHLPLMGAVGHRANHRRHDGHIDAQTCHRFRGDWTAHACQDHHGRCDGDCWIFHDSFLS